MDDLAALEPVLLQQRTFFDLSDISIGKNPYNAQNPIPQVKVFSRGVIWRVLLGNFASAQNSSVFRGASPLAVSRGEDGRYRYFAGGFDTRQAAEATLDGLRRAGFRAPSVVAWADGVWVDPAVEEKVYMLETPSAPPQDGVGNIVRTSEGGFIVGPMSGADALRLRTEIKDARLTKISE